MLHYDNDTLQPAAAASHLGVDDNKSVLLATAMAIIEVSPDNHQAVRILLDGGSQTSFVTEQCVNRLRIRREKVSFPVSGIGATDVIQTRGRVNLAIRAATGICGVFHIHAFIMAKLTSALPSAPMARNHISFINEIPLFADPQFDQPGDVDILLGGDILGELLREGRMHDERDRALYAQNTALGWVIAGPIPGAKSRSSCSLVAITDVFDIERALQRFWELETLGSSDTRTNEEVACEEHFGKTHKRDMDGRFVVQLPFRDGIPSLGDSRQSALRSFMHLERRFTKNPELHAQYAKFMNEYINLGHMSQINPEFNEKTSFYLPHHPVFKMASTTTKMRVVFDASRKSSSGVSLNDTLMVGPKLQRDLVDTLLRFRSHAVAFCGDLVKMYRQIRTTPASSDFQRILWRQSPTEDLRTYRLDTVTYGTSSASYLATKALQQLAIDEAARYPLASAVTLSDFYVDDLMTGCDSVEEALVLQKQLLAMMASGGFTLSKWASNHNAILMGVLEEHREVQCPLEIHLDETIKTLGLLWNPGTDCFQYRTNSIWRQTTPTKRIVLSEVASLFDPLGLLAPLVVAAKIFLQALWADGLNWDEPLKQHMAEYWVSYRSELSAIESLNVPRWLGYQTSNTHQLHGFCDASEAAYGAVVYLRSTNAHGMVTVRLLTARTKVAPVKKVSLPRLELCGAQLLANLLAFVKSSLNQPTINCRAWCDSTVTLAWIHKPSHCWQTFVANRVSIIQALTEPSIWRHVPGSQNPADAASRGLSASALVRNSLWWNGPSWLAHPDTQWPQSETDFSTKIEEASKSTCLLVATNSCDWLNRFSTINRLQRVMAFVQRFIHNVKNPKSRRIGSLQAIEILETMQQLARITQLAAFPNEIAKCKRNLAVETRSTLRTLNPFLDNDGLLRVGGRLCNANIPFNTRHPILLPQKCHLAELLIAAAHKRTLHGGPQLTIATLRQNYWVIAARSVVKHHILRCPVCIRYKQSRGRQLMASLPEKRTQSTRAFLSSGVDFAGPITIKLQPGRGTKTSKAYIALFVCFSTKAIHLELVSSLSSDAFLAAFRRFVARRGRCAHLHSDNGTNFTGACKELKSLHADVMRNFKENPIGDVLSNDGTDWHFNPPGAPSFGGIWEAGVKSVKHHLRRVMGETLFTFEELSTTLAQIEATLNSRPICPLTDDINDVDVLTPGHFLIGEPMNAAPDRILSTETTPIKRWHHMQQIVQHFWQRWRSEYITTLQQRHKWARRAENLEVGMLALIVDETLPPAKWALGRVTEVHAGNDGLVRVVTLKHKTGFIKRPVLKLVVFPKLA